MIQPAEKEYYTYADYLEHDECDRFEIIDGKMFKMTTPLAIHQRVSGDLFVQIANFLVGKQPKLYFRLCVRPFEKDGDAPENVDTVLDPDIFAVCDRSKLDDHGCKGAPDLIIEILSPTTARRDRMVKFNLYRRAGVREYWIVDPNNRSVEVFLLDEDHRFELREVYTPKDAAPVTVLEGCTVELGRVFPEEQ